MNQTPFAKALMRLAIACLFLAVYHQALYAQQVEEIKAKDGRVIKGTILSLDENTVKVKRDDGQTFSIPMESLEENFAKQLLITQLVEEKYDRFKDFYEFYLKKTRRLTADCTFTAVLHYYPKNVNKGLAAVSWGGSFAADSHEVYILADGKKIHPESNYMGDGNVVAQIGLEDFKIIACAKKVEAKVGKKEFTFSSQDVAAIEAVFLCWMHRVSKQ